MKRIVNLHWLTEGFKMRRVVILHWTAPSFLVTVGVIAGWLHHSPWSAWSLLVLGIGMIVYRTFLLHGEGNLKP